VEKAGLSVSIAPPQATVKALVGEIISWCGKYYTTSK
jgi:hypothetical protein